MGRNGAVASEALQQAAILGFLQAAQILAFRMNTGVHVAEYKGRKRIIRFGTPGMADIVAFPWFEGDAHPVTLWIEVKGDKGRQRVEQQSFEQQVTQHGMAYLLARSVDDVEEWLKRKGNA